MKHLDPKAIWLFMLNRNLWTLLVLYFFVVTIIVGVASTGTDNTSGLTIGLYYLFGLILASLTSFWWSKLVYKFYKYELASDAFHSERGVIYKRYISIPYERIQNVDIHRGVPARLLGLSDIDIQTAGRSSSGFSSEGRLPGLNKEDAIVIRDELLRLAKSAKSGV